MNRPLRQYVNMLSRPLAAAVDYGAACSLYMQESYEEALGLLAHHIQPSQDVRICQEPVSSENVLSLYCWCLYQLKRAF